MLAMYFFSYDLFLTERTEWHPKLANKLVSEKQAVHVHKVCLVFLWRKFESTRRDGATCSRHTKKSRIWALHQLSIVIQRLQWDKCTSSGGGWGRWLGSEWVVMPPEALMTWTHLGRLLNGHAHCLTAVYLLFSAVRSDLSPSTKMFTGVVGVALGFHASFGNAWMLVWQTQPSPWPLMALTPPASLHQIHTYITLMTATIISST